MNFVVLKSLIEFCRIPQK